MLLFSLLMAIIGAAISWKPVHQLAAIGKNKYPKWTISGNALLVIILPLIHPLAIIGSILLFLAMLGSKNIAKKEEQKQKIIQPQKQKIIQAGTPTPSIFEQKYYDPNTKRASPRPIKLKGLTEHQPFYDISTLPTYFQALPVRGDTVEFWYTNAAGEFSKRCVHITSITDDYIKGYDINKKGSRTFRIDRIDGEIVNTQTGEVYCL